MLVNGMGGIGKTSLAAAYVAQEFDTYQHIAWITHNSEDFADDIALHTGLLRSLDLLDITGERDEIFDSILHGLRSISKTPKLFVIDNATADIQRYLEKLPTQPNWHVLITSREEIFGPDRMDLGFLRPEDAVALFKKYCSRISEEDDIRTIVETVEFHTLTIEILARTAQRQRTKLPDLLNALRNNSRVNVLTAHSALDKIDRIRTYLETVFDFGRLDDNECWLLKQFVALPPDFHSYDVLNSLVAPERSDRAAMFSELLEGLAGKGWLLSDSAGENYKMHRVVNEAIGEKLEITPQDIEPLIANAATLLHVDQNRDNPIDKFKFVPFGIALTQIVNNARNPAITRLFNNLALVLKDLGQYDGARELLEKAMASDERNFGADHPTTAVNYSNLALVLQDLGQYNGARDLLEKAIASAERNFGADHPTTAVRYSNLATVLQDLGQYDGARELLEKAMASDERNFGADHPTTAVSYSNLALVLQDLGQYDGARELLEKAMASAERNFGADHPTTAVSYSNLALVLKALGQYDGARDLLEKAMASDERNFGADHPTTAVRYSNLALVLKALGQYGGARELLEKATASAERNFGADHPTTAVSYSNLALVLQDLGQYDGAKELLEKAVASDERNFGADHPTTAVSYSNLATVLQALGQYDGARELLEKAIASAEHNFGADHPTTAVRYSNLALVLRDLGQLPRALSLASAAQMMFRNSLPASHPYQETARRIVESIEKEIEDSGRA